MAFKDPNATHRGPSRYGGLQDTPTSTELGTVLSVDTERYAYDVRTLSGRPLQGVPRKRTSPGDLAILPVGTTVIVRFDLSFPYIDGVLELPANEPTNLGIPATAGSAASAGTLSQNYATGTYRMSGEPADLIAGDNLVGNRAGARVGVFEGGMAVFAASVLSQIRAHSLRNLIEIISRNYRHVTDMGEFKIENRDGRVNMSFRGASDQLGESGPDEEHWTINMDLGSVGDLFNFELTTPEGQTLFKFHVDSDGRCTIFGLDGVILQSGARNGEAAVTEQGGDATNIVRGMRTTETGGAAHDTVEGDRVVTTDGNHTEVCGNDHLDTASRDNSIAAGRDVFLAASKAMNIAALDGDLKTTVGQTATPRGAYSVETLRGRILLKSLQGGDILLETQRGTAKTTARKIQLNATGNDSVVLGGEALVAHLARFEQLEILVNAMFTHFDTHTHVASGSTTSTPSASMRAAVGRLVRAIKSTRVGVGG